MAYWLMKSEPETFGWDDLVRDGVAEWDGVRNHTAARNLRAMVPGDRAFFYHSVTGKEIVGIMEVSRAARPEGKEGDHWVSVEVKPVEPLPRPVTLAEIKAEPRLKDMALVRLSRLSVGPVREEEWQLILDMAQRPS